MVTFFMANNDSGSPIGEYIAVFSFAASGFSGVANKDDWCPGGAGDWSGKSVARDGAARGPPVLGLRPLLGHSLAFQATLGPSGAFPGPKQAISGPDGRPGIEAGDSRKGEGGRLPRV